MKKIYLLAAAALALAACDSNDVNPDDSQQAIKVFATIGESVQSRASDTQWAAGDRIGISSTVGAVGGPYINLKYTTAGTDGNFTGTPMFFYKPMTLTAYYPYSGEEGKVPGDHGVISATTDAAAQKNLPAIDFLWDQQTDIKASDPNKTSEPNVNFKFAHKMSKITFTFLSSEPVYKNGVEISKGVNVSDMVAYELEKLIVSGTFNTEDGVCKAKTDATEDKKGLKITFEKGTAQNEKALPSLIIFPQELPEENGVSTMTLRIYTDEISGTKNQEYKCNISFSDGEIKSGYHYKYSIKVTKYGLIVGQMSIDKWDDTDPKLVIATIDGEEPNFK